MRLSLRTKASFYQHMARLVRSGVTVPQAVERLISTSSGPQRAFLREVAASLRDGATFSEAMDRTKSITSLESTSIAALERTGRLDDGLKQLGDYFEAMYKSRAEIVRKSAYPVFILHLGVFLMNLPLLFTSAGAPEYLKRTAILLGVFYGIAAVFAIFVPVLRDAGAVNASLDRVLRTIPLIGKIRRSFALSRFCAAYDMQLDSGVNVIDSLQAAGRASRSGMISDAVSHAITAVRAGERVGPVLATHTAFPDPMKQSLLVAEETGSLDQELPRLASEYQEEGLTKLNTFSEWLPKLIYLGVMGFLAYNIVNGYKQYVEGVMSQIDSL